MKETQKDVNLVIMPPPSFNRVFPIERVLLMIGMLLMVFILHQHLSVPNMDLHLRAHKNHKPAVCNASDETWLSVMKGENHTDSCQKCEALQELDEHCGNGSAACDLCEASKSLTFFIESSNSTAFDGRQACVLESAARHHPNNTITVYVTQEMDCEQNEVMKTVCSIRNLVILPLDTNGILSEVGLPNWESERLTTQPDYRSGDLSVVLRLAMLYKKGGLYLDLDTMVLKPLLSLPYGFGHDGYVIPDIVQNSVMKLPPRSIFASELLKAINETYAGDDQWIKADLTLMTQIFNERCPQMKDFDDADVTCMGMKVYPVSYFHAIPWHEHQKFFDPEHDSLVMNVTKDSYGAHFWNHETQRIPIVSSMHQGISTLASKNCPNIFPNLAG